MTYFLYFVAGLIAGGVFALCFLSIFITGADHDQH